MTSSGDEVQVVVFTVDAQLFGFEISQVERIMRHEAPTPLPKAAAFLEGVVPYGDLMVPVVDLRKRLGVDPALTDESRVIVLQFDDHPVGVLVDQVLNVHRVDAAAITAPPKIVRGLAAEYITGMLTRGDQTIVMLNAAKLFTSKERLQLADASATAGTEVQH